MPSTTSCCQRRLWRLALVGTSLLLANGCTGRIHSADAAADDEREAPEGGGGGGGASSDGGRGGGAGAPHVGASPALARLSHAQWENAVRDLLRLEGAREIASTFTKDAVAGFDNEATGLTVLTDLRDDYERAAELLAERATADTAAIARLVREPLPRDDAARAHSFVRSFGLRAHRRPLTEQEAADYDELFAQGGRLFGSGDAFRDGARLVIQAMLQSPHFLYRSELPAEATESAATTSKIVPLDGYAIVTKLAFALTGTMPDDEALARAPSLTDSADVRAHAEELLASPRVEKAVDHFFMQWMQLPAYGRIRKDTGRFPEWKPELVEDFREEAVRFTRDAFVRGAGLAELLTTRSTFVNGRLAALYGVTEPQPSSDFVRVDLPEDERGGLLTRLGFLSVNADAFEPDIIHRGVFVNRTILCRELPPPAAGAAPVPTTQGKTNRQRVEAHTGAGTCGGACHADMINPLGYALERYDALGKWRTDDGGHAVDARTRYAFEDEPVPFDGAIELGQHLARTLDAHACFARAWSAYVLGRKLDAADDQLIAGLADVSLHDGVSMRDLVLSLVTSDAFTKRIQEATP